MLKILQMKILFTKTVKSIFALLLVTALQSHFLWAALSGTYTINPSGAASATNYKDLASAIGDLQSGTRTDGGPVNGPGVSAAVVFNVSGGTYTGQIDIPLIAGVSAVNTITFDGGSFKLLC